MPSSLRYEFKTRKRRQSRGRALTRRRKLIGEALEDRRVLATLSVNVVNENPSSSPVNNGDLTLREALQYVNDDFQPLSSDAMRIDDFGGTEPLGTNDRIVFASNVIGSIDLALGEIDIKREVEIEGPGASLLTIDAGGSSRIFDISSASGDIATNPVVISGLRFTGGDSSRGGAILATRSVSLIDTEFDGNSSQRGGAVSANFYTYGEIFHATITGSTFTNNEADSGGSGGAIDFQDNYPSVGQLTVSDSTFTGNSATGSFGYGGAISVYGAASIEASQFSGNSAGRDGGAIRVTYANGSIETVLDGNIITGNEAGGRGGGVHHLSAKLTIASSTIADNTAVFDGGGLWNQGLLAIEESTVSSNTTDTNGGGIWSSGASATIDSSTISNNAAVLEGGGIRSSAVSIKIENTTISNNTSSFEGGGIWQVPGVTNLTIDSSTITENRSASGGGLYGNPRVRLKNSIVAGNTDGAGLANNIFGNINPFGSFNILAVDGSAGTPGDGYGGLIGGLRGNIILPGNDPNLAPLQDNGGPTETHEPEGVSPAINNGDPARRYTNGGFDQRGFGFARVLDGTIDIGAVETNGSIVEAPIVGTADVVFLIDRSDSVDATQRAWLDDAIFTLDSAFAENGIRENRYGLTGFGLSDDDFAFSNLLMDGELFGDADNASTRVSTLNFSGGDEDGWDAAEHAVAEYNFRTGAYVHFVLVTDDVRFDLNETLTQDGAQTGMGIFDAISPFLDSRNVKLSVVANAGFTPHDIADRVFGVKASNTQVHPSIEYDDQSNQVLQRTFNESENFDTFGNIEDAYVKLAWSTGGAAWSGRNLADGTDIAVVVSFSEEFARGVAELSDDHSIFIPAKVITAIDFGHVAPSAAFPEADAGLGGTIVTASNPALLDDASGSIPEGTQHAFLTGREAGNGVDVDLSFQLQEGLYQVELFFAEIDNADRVFDVLIEGTTVLNDYQISEDWAKVSIVNPGDNGHLEVEPAGLNTGVVKVFEFLVSDGTLNISLNDEGGTQGPLLNALRILDASTKWLPGDYNEDAIVDAADFTVWRDARGQDVQADFPHAGSDGDGDGLVTESDYQVWRDNYGQYLRDINGDYNDDGIVDAADFTVWRDNLGAIVDRGTGADGNCDGVIDQADYNIWRATYGQITFEPTVETFVEFADLIAAPSVLNVTISGSNSIHDHYSMDEVDGSGDQLRSVLVGDADTVAVTFSEDVFVEESDLRFVGLATASVPDVAEFSYDVMTMTATWRFVEIVADDQFVIHIDDSVADTSGSQLDGEWLNPPTIASTLATISTFPSGDGTEGGDFNFVVTLLAGDFDQDNVVGEIDLKTLALNYMQATVLLSAGDANGDGVIDIDDVMLYLANNGMDLDSISILSDLDGDSLVGGSDLSILLDNWGMTGASHGDGDLDGDGIVGGNDLKLFLAQWGIEISVASDD